MLSLIPRQLTVRTAKIVSVIYWIRNHVETKDVQFSEIRFGKSPPECQNIPGFLANSTRRVDLQFISS